jgi:TatD DNase family protein
MIYYDSHFHACDCMRLPQSQKNIYFAGCTCAVKREEYFFDQKMILNNPQYIQSFGVHPYYLNEEDILFLEQLLAENKIAAVGEIGFDLFTQELKKTLDRQKKIFETQLDLAIKYDKPVVIHNRKALNLIFEYKGKLRKIKSVIFHGFSFGFNEALSILNNGINAYFSFGNILLKNSTKAFDACLKIPLDKILLESDAPFMTLKNGEKTLPENIINIYKKFALIKNIDEEELCFLMEENFKNAFCL